MDSPQNSVWILGDQLLKSPPAILAAEATSGRKKMRIVLVESSASMGRRPYQRKKLVLLLSAMRHFAETLRTAGYTVDCVRARDLVARLGGDEFAVVVVEDDGATAGQVAERILHALRVPFNINSTNLTVSVSIGVALRRPETVDAAELLRSADFAMYMAKGDGKDRYQTFDSQIHDDLAARTGYQRPQEDADQYRSSASFSGGRWALKDASPKESQNDYQTDADVPSENKHAFVGRFNPVHEREQKHEDEENFCG